MKNIKYLFIDLLLVTNILLAQNQGYMETISIPDGLSSPNVTNVYQDRFGYIWITTEDGLNRYDGSKIKVFRNDPDDPTTLSNNSIYSVVEDKKGFLWIGGSSIVSRFDYATEKFQDYQLEFTIATNEKFNRIISIFADSKGRIWAGSSGGYCFKYDIESQTFKSVSTEEQDLNSTSEIWKVMELKNGKILIADFKRGIYQYDESSHIFSKFFLGDNYSPFGIENIQEDKDGLIWFSGWNTIVRYNPNFYSYKILDEFNLQSSLWHYGFHKVNEENYIFITDPLGLIRYNPKTSKIIEIIRMPLSPICFTSDTFGIIWIAANGGLIKYDPNREPFTHIQFNTKASQNDRSGIISDIKLDKSDKIFAWLISSDNSLVKYNLKNGHSQSFKIMLPSSSEQIELDRFIQDRDGNFILGSTRNSGIYTFKIKTQQLSKFSKIPGVFEDRFAIRDFAFDQNNNLFVASIAGLQYYNFSNNTYFTLPTTANRMYNHQTEAAVKKALKEAKYTALITKADETKSYNIDFNIKEDGYFFIRCFGEGLLDDRSGQRVWDYGVLSRKNGEEIFKMFEYDKTYHAGGGLKNRRLYQVLRLEKGDYNLKYFMDTGHSYNNFNVPMPSDSNLYGIQLYEITESSYRNIKKQLALQSKNEQTLPFGNVRDIEVSRKFTNSIYISSDTQGLFRYNIINSNFTQYTFGDIDLINQKNLLQSCYEDISGNLWISTEQGLIWLNPDNSKWRVFTEKEGLPSNNILKTIEDNNGDLWVISLGGLSKFNKNESADKWNFVNYDTRDGLTGYSFNGNPARTPDGEILFIVGDDLHRFTPGKSSTIKPYIVIDDLKISDESVFKEKTPIHLEKGLMETETMVLSHDMNDLSFNFNVIHYSRPYKNKMYYKMEGFNKDWIESELGNATFTNLDPGFYEFKVRGISADGIRNDEGKSIKIIITPPWWRTTFAYIGYFLLFAGLIFTIDRIQRRRVLIKERSAAAIKEAELRAQLAESENERKSKELEEARNLQLSMLPKELPQLPHLDIAVYMQTATEVGGDYYDFHVSLDGTLTVVVGDATGHGMKAGTMVTTAKSLFNSYAPNPDILFSFQEITRCIKQMNFGKLSMCLTMLKMKGNKMQISTAGMPPSFIFRRDTRIVEEHLFKAMPLGTMDKFPYEIKDTTLNAGDTILLMSDGLPELENSKGEMYGYKRIRNGFEEVAEKSPEDIISYLKNEGSSWVNNEAPDDDVTFVVIKVK
jgi:serine phosphatase RsbU (regulator of sigma subunit)/ligand-binding sensor domain-containing protein